MQKNEERKKKIQAINRFEHIQHTPLRVFNRVVMSHNLLEDSGEDASKEYIASFDDEEKKQMFLMNAYISQVGPKVAQETVTKGLNIEYNVGEVDEDEPTIN